MNETSISFADGEARAPVPLSSPEHALFAANLPEAIDEIRRWATEQGLRGATARDLFEGYCRRLEVRRLHADARLCVDPDLAPAVDGLRLYLEARTESVREQQFARGGPVSQEWLASPFYALIQRSQAGEKKVWMRRRLDWPHQRDFPALVDFYNAGGTDYLCLGFRFGESADPSHGTGVLYSFTTDHPGGFHDAEIELLHSTLPELSLAMKAHAGYDIASGLLGTYLGYDVGARVHSGAVERGSVNGLHSVLWYADLRGFTRISDVTSGAQIVEMLNETFEMLTASLRTRGGHVLKFIGDAMLATISFEEAEEEGRLQSRRRGRGGEFGKGRFAEPAAPGGRAALRPGRHRAPRRRSAVRQRRRCRSARLYRHRTGGQRSRPNGEALRYAWSPSPLFLSVRRGRGTL